MQSKKKVGFPRMDHYNVALQYLVETGLDCQYVMAPPMTRKTLELGSKYSPDFVCAPFKYTLGSMLEMLQQGVDTIVETGGVCRLGYYGELQKQILRDLGYDVQFLNLADMGKHKIRGYRRLLRELNPRIRYGKAARALSDALTAVRRIDELEGRVRTDRGTVTVSPLFYGGFRLTAEAATSEIASALCDFVGKSLADAADGGAQDKEPADNIKKDEK